MERRPNRHVFGVVCLAFACLLGCGGAMTDIDDSTSPGDAMGGSAGSEVGVAQGGAIRVATGIPFTAGSNSGGYATIVLPPSGGAAADYRCSRPVDTGEPCAGDSDGATDEGIIFDVATGTCATASFFRCGNSTLAAAFSTPGGCAAACQGAPSSGTCDTRLPVAGTPCGHESELCIYQATSGSSPCLCTDFGCKERDCWYAIPIVDVFSGSCREGLCVAESPILALAETKTVCRCSAGTWECEEFRRYDY